MSTCCPETSRVGPSPAERLLTPPYPGPDGQVQSVKLLPGRLPDEPPLDLPLPPDSRLVGSLVREAGDRGTGVDVALDAAGDPAAVMAFYDAELAAHGWTIPPSSPGGLIGGFQATPAAPTSRGFCQDPSGPWLSLTASPGPGGTSQVRLRLELSPPGPCAASAPPRPTGPPGADLLPPLHAPAGVQLQGVGMSGGPNRWTSEATAEADISVAELEAHFAQQLEGAGWTRQAGRADGPLAWSTWSVPGEGEWQGLLLVVEGPGQGRRSLMARVESASAQASGSSYSVAPVPAVVPPEPPQRAAPKVREAPKPAPTSDDQD